MNSQLRQRTSTTAGRFLGAAAALMFAGSAFAQTGVHEADFVLRINADNQLETGVVDDGQVVYPARVNTSELGSGGTPNFIGDPGVDSEPGNLLPGMEVGFDLVAPTKIWDGSAFVATPDVLTVRKNFVNYATPATEGQTTPGAVFGDANNDPGAVFHHHVQFFRNFGDVTPVDGVWLLSWELWTNEPGIARTEPVYIVFFQGAGSADVEDAVAWVESNLIATPCPADISGDGILNNTDINAFVSAFLGQQPVGDFNGDGNFNNTDINQFVAAFLNGCG